MDQQHWPPGPQPSSSSASEPSGASRSGHLACNERHEQKIDNSCKILEKIAGLYADRLLSDISLEVGGKRYPAHRLILCASSDVFQVMLMNPSWSEAQESNIVLLEDPPCAAIFPEFLKYLYTGRIEINYSQVLPLLVMGDKYNIKDLVTLAVDYMVSHIVKAAENHLIVSWLQYTLNCGHEKVTTAAKDFISWNFESVASKEDFASFETDVLVTLLQSSSLVVKDEYTLFNHVAHWLEQQFARGMSKEDVEGLTEHVMSHIRFPMMCPRQLANLLLNPLVVKFKDFFVDRMSSAMAYHSGQDIGTAVPNGSGRRTQRSHQPRLYTAEKWSSSLVIENFKNLPAYGSRTLVFQTPSSLREDEANLASFSGHRHHHQQNEWAVDIFPKGIWFKKFLLIVWQGTLEMPEWVSKTVRLSVSAVRPGPSQGSRVCLGIMIHGQQDGVDHVRKVIRREFHTSDQEKMMNIDDLIPFEQLNGTGPAACCPNSAAGIGGRGVGPLGPSPFLVGPDMDTLKIQITITPIDER